MVNLLRLCAVKMNVNQKFYNMFMIIIVIFCLSYTACSHIRNHVREEEIDICTACEEMLREMIVRTLVELENASHCLEDRHGLGRVLPDADTDDIIITKAELLARVQEFTLESLMIKEVHVNQDQCIHHNLHKLHKHLTKLTCLLTSSSRNQDECTITKQFLMPQYFSDEVDRTRSFIRGVYLTLSGYLSASQFGMFT